MLSINMPTVLLANTAKTRPRLYNGVKTKAYALSEKMNAAIDATTSASGESYGVRLRPWPEYLRTEILR